jgi:hypothetical protein
VLRAPNTARPHIELARICLGISNEFRNRPHREGWINVHGEGRDNDTRDRSNVANEIVVEPFVKCRIDRIRWSDQEKRVTVRGRAHDRKSMRMVGGKKRSGCAEAADEADRNKRLKVHILSPG